MNEYQVKQTDDPVPQSIKADAFEVKEYGDLVFMIGRNNVMAFSRWRWEWVSLVVATR